MSDTHAAVNAAAVIKSREVQKWSEVMEPTTRPAVMNKRGKHEGQALAEVAADVGQHRKQSANGRDDAGERVS
jgi:hypothetical protein